MTTISNMSSENEYTIDYYDCSCGSKIKIRRKTSLITPEKLDIKNVDLRMFLFDHNRTKKHIDFINASIENEEEKKEYKTFYEKRNMTQKQIEECREYQKEYSKENKEKIKEKGKKYYEKNKEKIKEKSKKYLEANKEKFICCCGSELRKADKARHEKTKKHIKWIENNKTE